MEQAKPPEVPKPKGRPMVLAIIIVVILVAVGVGVYILTTPPPGPTIGQKLTVWDTSGSCLQTASPPDCGYKDSSGSPNVTIAVGTTVQWTNNGGAPHTVTACDPTHASGSSIGCPTANASTLPAFDSGTVVQNGGTYTYTFNQAGTYHYYCTIHPWMHGVVTVQ